MSQHNGQTSSQSDTHSNEIQWSTLGQQNKRSKIELKPFEITKIRISDELNILLNTALQLKNHYCGTDQQPPLHLPEKSQIARTAFLSYLFET